VVEPQAARDLRILAVTETMLPIRFFMKFVVIDLRSIARDVEFGTFAGAVKRVAREAQWSAPFAIVSWPAACVKLNRVTRRRQA